jgi:hypothetical protein
MMMLRSQKKRYNRHNQKEKILQLAMKVQANLQNLQQNNSVGVQGAKFSSKN